MKSGASLAADLAPALRPAPTETAQGRRIGPVPSTCRKITVQLVAGTTQSRETTLLASFFEARHMRGLAGQWKAARSTMGLE